MSDIPPFVDEPIDTNILTDRSLVLSEVTRSSTRGDGIVQLDESFETPTIDFSNVLSHLKIHYGGEVAGSQFNGDVFHDTENIVKQVSVLLPPELQYDQHGRAEITLKVADNKGRPIGWSGVKSTEEVRRLFPEAIIEKEVRIPGGEKTDGGAWYPEMKEAEFGEWVIDTDETGQIRNPHGKFEPEANIAIVPATDFERVAATDRITIIIQKDRGSGKPVVLTVFPGDNAPSFPAKIETDDYKSDTTGNTPETGFWNEHVFLRKD